MTGQLKPYYHRQTKRWVVSINKGKHPDGRRNRKYFYGKTPAQAVEAARGARSPDRMLAIDAITTVLDNEPALTNPSRAALLEAMCELETNL